MIPFISPRGDTNEYWRLIIRKDLGAAKTSAYYSVAPFLGVVFGMVLLGERPGIQFYIGLILMIAATECMKRQRDTSTVMRLHKTALLQNLLPN